jgi:peptidoglycan/xylan/chitin deacetylase (PgdA/CDA1 family)
MSLWFNVPVAAEDKLIVLTFDDGPRPKILEGNGDKQGLINVLESFRVPAHFFMIGANVQNNSELVARMSQRGFLIENHTYGHDNLVKLRHLQGNEAVSRTIQKASEVIYKTTGRRPRFLRPPYWEVNKEIKKLAENEKLQVLELGNPDINSYDYDDYTQRKSPEVLVERIKRVISARERRGITRHVLTFHELSNSVEALRTLIPYFSNREYIFGTLNDFFAVKSETAYL